MLESSTPDYGWRPFEDRDAHAIAEIANAASDFAGGFRALDDQVVRGWSMRPGGVDSSDLAVLLQSDGTVAGFSWIYSDPPGDEPVWSGAVTPRAHRFGMGREILRYAEERARMMTWKVERPVLLLCRVATGLESVTTLLRAAGFTETRHLVLMHSRLNRVNGVTPPPPGIVIRSGSPERDGAQVYELMSEAFSDHWGTSWPAYETWVDTMCDAGNVWILALDGNRLIGALIVRIRLAEQRQYGELLEMGVRREWRRAGVSRALTSAAVRALAAHGADGVAGYVDGESTTGVRDLFRSMGLDAQPRYTYWTKPLT